MSSQTFKSICLLASSFSVLLLPLSGCSQLVGSQYGTYQAGRNPGYQASSETPNYYYRPAYPAYGGQRYQSVTGNKSGNHLFLSDGTTITRIGNHAFSSNGMMATQIGNHTFFNDGTTATQIGDHTFFSNGVTGTRIGNHTFFSDGSTATQIGNTTFFNQP